MSFEAARNYEEDPETQVPKIALWREDTIGNLFRIGVYTSPDEAAGVHDQLSQRGHNQDYTIRPAPPGDDTTVIPAQERRHF